MSLNSNSKFAQEPRIKIRRSAFNQDHTYKTTFNNGLLVPFYWNEVLPADTFSLDTDALVRMSTPIKPIMDNVILDTYYFFVPNRLLWSKWKRFMGELGPNEHWRQSSEETVPQFTWQGAQLPYWYKEIDWLSSTELELLVENRWYGTSEAPCPQLAFSTDGGTTITDFTVGLAYTYNSSYKYYVKYTGPSPDSLSCYLGIAPGANPIATSSTTRTVSQLPFRAYCLIWNEYFRDQNYMDPCDILYNDDTTYPLVDVHGYKNITVDSSFDLRVWYNDYVNKAVKGAMLLPVSRFHDYFSSALPQPQRGDPALIPTSLSGSLPVYSDSSYANRKGGLSALRFFNSTGTGPMNSSSNQYNLLLSGASTGVGNVLVQNTTTSSNIPIGTAYTSLYGEVGANVVNYATINDLRTAFQVQKFLEQSARSGCRYIEVIEGFFGVKNPDSRIQRPEFLAWKRDFINVTQVLQTSSTDSTSPQGNTAAYSLTVSKQNAFTKSFTEHGLILGVCCTRTTRSYQQGYSKLFERERKFDYYWPQFAHLGEQPIYGYELYANSGNFSMLGYANGVLGYQERNAEYKYFPDVITGQFNSQGPQPLDFWHFGDSYFLPPYISKEWLFEGPEQLDRCLAVTSDQAHQFQADFYIKSKLVRPMPMYSIPGLADHF